MNMQNQKKNWKELSNELDEILEFNDDGLNLKFEEGIINTDMMSVVSELMKGNSIKTREELAEKLNVSASYVSQLFAGSKKFNVPLLAKLQRVFNVSFKVVTSDMIK